jgi:hypothetical protein
MPDNIQIDMADAAPALAQVDDEQRRLAPKPSGAVARL